MQQRLGYLAFCVFFAIVFCLSASGAAASPVITNITMDAVTHSSIRIAWNTDVPTNRSIEYGLTPAYGGVTYDNGESDRNVWYISGLAPNTQYHFRIKANVTNGGINYSPDMTFTTLSDSGSDPALPELPRVYVDTSLPTQTGQVRTVDANCTNLQNLIQVAVFGDTISIPAGTTCVGTYLFPVKTGNGWVVITGGGALPAEHVRVTPLDAPQLGKIKTPNVNVPAVRFEEGAHHYRFVGLEISPASPTGFFQSLAESPGTAHHIIFDRVYFHGNSHPGKTLRGLRMNGNHTAVIDSYFETLQWYGNISTFLDSIQYNENYGMEAYAIIVDLGGPGKIVNNYIEAVGITTFIGTDNSNQPVQDFEIRGNYFTIPDKYRYHVNNPLSDGNRYAHRQLYESKKGQRFVIDGNIFERSFCDLVSSGENLVLSPRPGGVRLSDNIISDFTITNNIFRNLSGAISIAGHSDSATPDRQPRTSQRILIGNNLVYDIDGYTYASHLEGSCRGKFLTVYAGIEDVIVTHNTVYDNKGTGPSFLTLNRIPSEGLKFTDNILYLHDDNQLGGIRVTENVRRGTDALNFTWQRFPLPSWVFANNVIVNLGNIVTSTYPSGNTWLATGSAIGFTDVLSRDFTLSASSPYRTAGTGGTALGTDMTALQAAVAATMSGNAAPESGSSLRITQLSATVTENTALLSWDTNAISNSLVLYGRSSASELSKWNVNLTLQHSILLTNLTPNTRYFFNVSSQVSGMISSQVGNFTTAALPGISRTIIISLEGAPTSTATGALLLLDGNQSIVYNFTANDSGAFTVAVPENLTVAAALRVVVPGYLSTLIAGPDLITRALLTIAVPTMAAGDFNGDSQVNSLDWSVMNVNWFRSHNLADINRDGIVNALDFSIVSTNWLKRGA